MCMNYVEFISSMAPFINRSYVPYWFRRKFPTFSHGNQSEALDIWVAFFKPNVLSTRFSFRKVGLGLVECWISSKFGFCQFLPRSLFINDMEICMANTILTKKNYKVCLDFDAKKVINLIPFKFEAFFYGTKEFEEWWTTYHNSFVVDY